MVGEINPNCRMFLASKNGPLFIILLALTYVSRISHGTCQILFLAKNLVDFSILLKKIPAKSLENQVRMDRASIKQLLCAIKLVINFCMRFTSHHLFVYPYANYYVLVVYICGETISVSNRSCLVTTISI